MLTVYVVLKIVLFASSINNVYGSSSPPNIIFIIADDLGWDDLQYSPTHSVITPTISKFRSEGRVLEWYYGQAVCAPSRSSMQSGRYPCHIGINTNIVANYAYCPDYKNKYIAEILYNYSNYTTHAIGKWHCGFYKWRCTPTYRGYETFYGYYGGGEDYYNHTLSNNYDFHNAIGLNCGPNCSYPVIDAYGIYSTYLFTDRAIEIIKNHSNNYYGVNKPLFMYLAFQNVHMPNEAPSKYVDIYNHTHSGIPILEKSRLMHAAQATALDDAIKNITNVLEELGYLNDENGNTLIVFTSDNGGLPANGGGYNWPLRGGKLDIWDGGVRLNAFIWATKDIMKNKDNLENGNYTQLMHVADWLPTLAFGAAQIDINDVNLSYSLDGINHWNSLIGNDDDTNDPYFKYRNSVFHGWNMAINEAHYKDIGNCSAFRYQWIKVINNSCGPYDLWYYPPNIGPDIDRFNMDSMKSIGDDKLNDPFCFNISSDGEEIINLVNNSDYQPLFDKVWNMMVDIENTCIQLENDTNCPPLVNPVIQINGRNVSTWEPWCGEY